MKNLNVIVALQHQYPTPRTKPIFTPPIHYYIIHYYDIYVPATSLLHYLWGIIVYIYK